MNSATVRSALVEVVRDIQTSSGYDSSIVSGGAFPLKDLQGFDSMICAEAMSMLSSALDIEIADDMNIFITEDSKTPLTINQAADVVFERLNKGGT